MQEQHSKPKGFGGRGWLLILWVATAMFSYVVAGNYPLNIMTNAPQYGPATTVSLIYTGASIVGIIIQVIFSRKIRNWKKVSTILGIATLVFMVLEMIVPAGTDHASVPWLIVFGIATGISALYGTWATAVLVGVWFPRRKGTVMGIITFAFPIGNALLGGFAGKFLPLAFNPETAGSAALMSLWPYVLVVVIGFIIGVVFCPEFPEKCGAYRDNDKSMTPEMANQMMMQEIENRKTTVWTTGHTVACQDFWLITIPLGLLLMFAVGAMTQSMAIISPYAADYAWIGGYNGVMYVIAAFGIIGSYIFGLIDTKKGTKFAVLLSHICMLISGILGALGNATALFVGLILLAMFMGASSNYTVSAAVQYWRIEDFPSVFSVVNPVANFINAFGPTIVAALIATALGTQAVFIVVGIAAIISIICCLLFKPARVKAYDDKYRAAAGKPLDDVLVGRK
jgi:MFS family permease